MENVHNIRSQIYRKLEDRPYIAPGNAVSEVYTDQDSFPYTRWYRGIAHYHDKPVVAEREAGYRPRKDQCYHNVFPYNILKTLGDCDIENELQVLEIDNTLYTEGEIMPDIRDVTIAPVETGVIKMRGNTPFASFAGTSRSAPGSLQFKSSLRPNIRFQSTC